jgi:AcrR family transcriptional regulator
MGPKDRQERERDAMRAKILSAARELFVKEGYDAVSMRQVAKRIEYTPTTLYLYFEDKEAIFRALCDADFLTLRSVFDQIAEIKDPVERLREIGRAYVAFALKNPNHYRFMFMTPPPFGDVKSKTIERGNPDQDVYAFVLSAAADAIAAGKLRAEFNDPELVTQILWAAVHGLVALRLTHANDAWVEWRSETATTEALIDATLRGLLANKKG